MATELHNTSETVEPSSAHAPKRQSLIHRFESRLQNFPCGRLALGCLQWTVVSALVLSGYFGAEAVNTGVELAKRGDTTASHQIIVAAAAAPAPHK